MYTFHIYENKCFFVAFLFFKDQGKVELGGSFEEGDQRTPDIVTII